MGKTKAQTIADQFFDSWHNGNYSLARWEYIVPKKE